jgi:hypothetical protein
VRIAITSLLIEAEHDGRAMPRQLRLAGFVQRFREICAGVGIRVVVGWAFSATAFVGHGIRGPKRRKTPVIKFDSKPAVAGMLAMMMFVAPVTAQDGFSVGFADPAWDGDTIPEGQHCSLQGGTGASPALEITGLPEGTTQITVAYNDESYEPMNDGGHGTLGLAVEPGATTVTFPSVPGETDELSDGVTIAAANRTSGDFLSPGYMPPCSGGRGNTYSADVSAIGADGAELATTRVTLGTY